MSDEDLFFSQKEATSEKEVTPTVSKSQPLPSVVEYHWVIVFHWCIENRDPFSVFLRNVFTEEELPRTWLEFKLSDENRLKKQYIRTVNGEYSFFCKVEKGKKKKYNCQRFFYRQKLSLLRR